MNTESEYRPLGEGHSDLQSICHDMSQDSPKAIVGLEGGTHIIRYLNPAFCKLAGRSATDMLGKSFFEVVPSPLSFGCSDMFDRVLRTKIPETLNEDLPGDDCARHWTFSTWVAFAGKAIPGKAIPAGIVVLVSDALKPSKIQTFAMEVNEALLLSSVVLTEKTEKINVELKNAKETKNQFLAVMSHEIRTPLNAITGFAEILSSTQVTEANRVVFGERIKRNTTLLLRLIDDLIDLSRVEAGKLDFIKSVTNLSELFPDIMLIMKTLADAKNIEISIEIGRNVPENIMSDSIRLKQILINIIGNAVKFTRVGSVKIKVDADFLTDLLRVTVIDTGPGISRDKSIDLFEPFSQGDATTTRQFGGTGLGLGLSRRIARGLGGDVKLLKSFPGEGCVFEITVSTSAGSANSLLSPPAFDRQLVACSLHGVHVLLAEDAPDNQFLVCEFLTSVGASIDIAEDGEAAIDMASRNHYDIILMDIQMPKVDGYDATTQIRDSGYLEPIIALTAHAMKGERERCERAGCDKFMTKPIDRIDLITMIDQLVTERKYRPFHH